MAAASRLPLATLRASVRPASSAASHQCADDDAVGDNDKIGAAAVAAFAEADDRPTLLMRKSSNLSGLIVLANSALLDHTDLLEDLLPTSPRNGEENEGVRRLEQWLGYHTSLVATASATAQHRAQIQGSEWVAFVTRPWTAIRLATSSYDPIINTLDRKPPFLRRSSSEVSASPVLAKRKRSMPQSSLHGDCRTGTGRKGQSEKIVDEPASPLESSGDGISAADGHLHLMHGVQSVSGQRLDEKYTSTARSDQSMCGERVDWTRFDTSQSSDFISFFRGFGWDGTPFGPMASWSLLLRAHVVKMLADPDPVVIVWGPDKRLLYNERVVEIIGQKHPGALAARADEAFGELWYLIAGHAEDAMRGRSLTKENVGLPIFRRGFLEETFYSFTFLPLIGDDGTCLGLWDKFTERTERVVTERRMELFAKLAEYASYVTSSTDLWAEMVRAFEDADNTIPFALVYTAVDDERPNGVESAGPTKASKVYELGAFMGIARECVPESLDLYDYGSDPLVSHFAAAWEADEPVFLRAEDGSLPAGMQTPSDSGRAFGDACQAAAICPISFAQKDKQLVALVILGLNPRRPADEHGEYMALLNRRMVDIAATRLLPEQERRQRAAQEEATLRHAALTASLRSRTAEAEKKQARFVRLAERAPVGMFVVNPDASFRYVNDPYLDLLGLPREATSRRRGWEDAILPEDQERVANNWDVLAVQKKPLISYFRVKKTWTYVDDEGHECEQPTWLMASAYPELAEDGEVVAIVGWLADISQQKFAESVQRDRLRDALEGKKQSERFIDMVSHEIRNPLSAILQCADGISSAIEEVQAAAATAAEVVAAAASTAASSPAAHPGPVAEAAQQQQEPFALIAENSQTIVLCANHQLRIIGDILTLSKLDANLLLMTPDRTEPEALARTVLRMYDGECRRHAIRAHLAVDASLAAAGAACVALDPTRLTQVLVNLMTNAIKFTAGRPRREIVLRVGAAAARPARGLAGSPLFARRRADRALHTPPPLPDGAGGGAPVFVQFAVCDSGRGLSPDAETRLFGRFEQASAKTHVEYGGSGLGLFVSRELTEMHDGQIGVSSEEGRGSAFEFYFKAWRCAAVPSLPAVAAVDSSEPPARPVEVQLPAPMDLAPDGATLVAGTGAPAPDGAAAADAPPEALHVLVVEDNLINQKVMATQLQRRGCVVAVANHGGEALAFLRTTARFVVPQPATTAAAATANGDRSVGSGDDGRAALPEALGVPLSVVLLDWEMPVMDGLECVRRIRAWQREGRLRGHVPVIGVTANARDAQRALAIQAGMDMVVTKPFRIQDLLPQIEKLVREKAAVAG